MSIDANLKLKIKSAAWVLALAVFTVAPVATYAQDLPELEMETEESQIPTDIDIEDVLMVILLDHW